MIQLDHIMVNVTRCLMKVVTVMPSLVSCRQSALLCSLTACEGPSQQLKVAAAFLHARWMTHTANLA